jgi:hypothetical protein
MAYQKHNFSSGDTLYASQLNEMDAQIALNEQTAKSAVKTVNGTAPDANGNEVVSGGGSSYTLPTGSADVKGGVKVGEGLQMDGDVLSVAEAPYELIEEYTIPEGGIATFRRTEEPDGTPYNFKAIRIKTQMDVAGAANLSPNFIARNGDVQLGNMYAANVAHTSGKRYAIIDTLLERGAWTAYGCTSATSASGTITRYLWAKSGELKEAQYPVINHLYCSAALPEGLKIIVEAVRA